MITKTEKQVAACFALLVALAAIAWFTVEPAYGQKPPSPPGQGECAHGNSQKPCKEDPQPDRGKDCEEHGPKEGGVNEDHCKGTPTTPEETTPEETTPEETTPEETTSTPTETTPETPAKPEAPASPESPSSSAPEAPAAPSAEEEFQEALEQDVKTQAQSNGATSTPSSGTGNPTRATEVLPYTGLSLWWAVALSTGLVASGIALRRRRS